MEPIAVLLGRVSQELVTISDLVASLEEAVGKAIQDSPAPADIRVEEFQSLDLIRQQVTGLSDFIASMAAACPSDWRLDMRSTVGLLLLSDQASRLVHSDCAANDSAVLPGECELFS